MENCFRSLSGTGFPIFSARRIIRKESCFCKMETPPRIARCPRKLWINSLQIIYDTPSVPWSKPHLEHISSCWHVCVRKGAIMKKIKRETYEQFCNRVTNALYIFPSDITNRAITSMPKTNRCCHQNERAARAPLGDCHIFWKSLGKYRTFSFQ